MADIKKNKVENSKEGKLDPVGTTVNWGNAEKIKILLLDKINTHLAELVKLMRDVKDSNG